jgi:AraC-like DNA-binding protein
VSLSVQHLPESQETKIAIDPSRVSMRKLHALLAAAHPGEPIYISELSAVLGVSERTLRNRFKEHLGMGLRRYLILRRLHFVRRALHKADPAVTSVTDVATEFGFWELGRFAGAYKLSRDSRLGQRNDCTLAVQVFDCLVNGAIEFGDVSEGLMSQIVRLQVVPDDLDVV